MSELDAPTKAALPGVVDVIAEELYTAAVMDVAVGTPEDARHVAEIAAAALAHRFEIHERSTSNDAA